MSGRQRLFFKAGCWAAFVTAVVHMVGHLSGTQPAANDTERQLIQLYETYRFALPGGGARSLSEFMSGFSLIFAAALAMFGGTNLMLVRRCAGDAALMRMATALALAFSVTLLVISLTHFFIAPTLFIAAVAVCFAAAIG
jgi:hypothetical protein